MHTCSNFFLYSRKVVKFRPFLTISKNKFLKNSIKTFRGQSQMLIWLIATSEVFVYFLVFAFYKFSITEYSATTFLTSSRLADKRSPYPPKVLSDWAINFGVGTPRCCAGAFLRKEGRIQGLAGLAPSSQRVGSFSNFDHFYILANILFSRWFNHVIFDDSLSKNYSIGYW